MSLLEKYLLLSLFLVFLLVFFRWLKRYLRRNEIQERFPYVYPFGKEMLGGQEVLKLELPQKAQVRIEVIERSGHFHSLAFEGELPAGLHQLNFDCSGIRPGSYDLRLVFPNQVTTRPIVIG
jgi:hypothetical protein